MSDTPPDTASHARQGKAWSAEEDRQLYDAFVDGQPIDALASKHERSAGGIRARLDRLGLVDESGAAVIPPPPFAAPARARPAAPGPHAPNPKEDDVKSIFAIRTADGWVVDIRSNRPLSGPLVDRLTWMLNRVLDDDESR